MNIQKENWRFEYPLGGDSVVFDVGGYLGDWAAEIAARYNPYVHVFEPIPRFYKQILHRFQYNPKIHVHDIGLSDHSGIAIAWDADDASGIYGCVGTRTVVQLRDVAEEFPEDVDLIKINIEGEEYALLNRLIDAELVSRCSNIQVQFHKFMPNAEASREKLWAKLQKTHYLTRNDPFVWENWRSLHDG